MPTDILITAPLPPFLYEPLKSDYRCHDYVQSKDKAGLLAAEGGRIRGLVRMIVSSATRRTCARPKCRLSV